MTFETDFFDLYQVFVNEVIGGVTLAIIIAMVIVAFAGLKSRMPFEAIFLFEIMVISAFISAANIQLFWVFLVLAVGTFFYFNVANIISR